MESKVKTINDLKVLHDKATNNWRDAYNIYVEEMDSDFDLFDYPNKSNKEPTKKSNEKATKEYLNNVKISSNKFNSAWKSVEAVNLVVDNISKNKIANVANIYQRNQDIFSKRQVFDKFIIVKNIKTLQDNKPT